ncbi:hypothetical protein DW923_01190 [Butyricicoccus sp. AM42-5AC]|uniref:SpaA isopeptide-forming pilin-related protein n=1 Tax=Agathobaculum sp. TaxID=2048138 RepID=UPI000E52B6FC|nr:hypothetical protein DW923_01190 [Butyricicoccus sp. AM42-5AC]
MKFSLPQRFTAAILSAVTVLSCMTVSIPLAGAADEDNKASAIEIKVGETYNISDNGTQKAWFRQNGSARNVWPMYTKASDGTTIRAYCADHAKTNPGTGGKPYTVTGKVSDMHVYGVATRSDSRTTLNEFISWVQAPLTASNFTADMYFSASQAAIWVALGDAQIAANNSFGVSYTSSTALGYRASGKTLSASTTSEALTLYAAIKMLEYGNTFYNVWGPNGKNHAPWTGCTINYTPGSSTYNAANVKNGSINLTGGIIKSGVFAEKQIDGQTCLVLPMAAASATFVRGNKITLKADKLPIGAFLMSETGVKSTDGTLTLGNVRNDKTLYKNGNDMAYGETFLLCIPKTTAEQMDAADTKLQTAVTATMNVDRYDVYVASTNAGGVQPVILVEPAVKQSAAQLLFVNQEVAQGTVRVRILKTDEAGAGLTGCTFELTYPGQKAPLTSVSSSSGEVVFNDLPLNTNVTIKETAAPKGYTLLPAKTVNTGTKSGQTIELQLANSTDHTFKIHKISSADGRNLMGATFEIRGIDSDYKHSFTTDALGEITVQGRDLPTGSFEVYEIAAPEGYATDGSDIQTFAWDNSKDIELSFKDAPRPGIKIYKYDKDTKMPLEGATFEIRRDGQVLATVKTDVNGNAGLYDLPKGFYQVVETEPPQGYLRDEQVHEVYIDPTADPTQLIREVNVANTKKLSIRIVKIDKETKVPLSGWKFDVYYNDAHLTTVTTNQNGEAMVENLQPGTYRVKETGGDTEHYNMDAGEQTVELVKDQAEIPTLTFANTIKKHFGILKIDSETHKPIEGVTFEIYKDGKLLGNYTTGADGRIWLPYAEPGTYQAKEVVTDPKYVLNEKVFTIENNSEYPTFFTIPNVMKKDITVTKIDKDTGKPLQGVVFQGFKDGKSIGYFTTGADGKFTISYADSGTYTFREYHTLAGYVLNKEPITIEHTTDGNVDIIVDNTVQKKFEVVKVDSQTKQPLAGVQFKIWRDATLLGDYTTDENGKITIEKAPAGTYKVQEVATLKEYILNDKPLEIEHTTDKDTSITVENTKKPGLSITKIDAETKKPLSGAVFKLTRANGDVIREDITTGEDGTAFVEGLDAADYIVTEITAPGGYILDKNPRTISLEQGKTYTLTIENTKKPGLLIKKVDAQTSKPLAGASFKVTRGDGSVVRENVVSDADGIVHLAELDTGTYIITETKAPDGYVIDETPKTVQLRKGQTYEVVFSNSRSYGLQIRKIIKGTNKPLSGCVFQVAKANGEIIGKYTTNSAGLATVSGLEDGVYVVTELSCPEGYRLDSTPQNVIVKSGELATVEFQNEKLASIRIKKIDAVTKKGIYGVRFLVKDEANNLIGEYSTDQDGYIELRDILTDGKSEIKLKVEEIAAAQGYVLDSTVRTLRIRRGETTGLVVENTPVLGQIQVVKKSSQDNPVTNQLKGSLLQGAVFEVENAETGRIVDTITTDSRGIAASNPLPLGRYFVREIKAPRFYQLNTQKVEVKLKVEGDAVRIEMYNDAASIKTSIKKTGNYTVDAGDNMRYDITNVANQSNVPLDNFFWHDRIPTDAVRVGTITTGTYNARVWYKITYKTNKNGYRVLADNLLSTNRYSFKVDSGSLKLAIGEYVTDIRYEFGTVPAGFKMTEKATVYVYVPPYMGNGYNITNRVDCGGSYQGEWDSSMSAWVTKIHRVPIYTKPTLPKTGY